MGFSRIALLAPALLAACHAETRWETRPFSEDAMKAAQDVVVVGQRAGHVILCTKYKDDASWWIEDAKLEAGAVTGVRVEDECLPKLSGKKIDEFYNVKLRIISTVDEHTGDLETKTRLVDIGE